MTIIPLHIPSYLLSRHSSEQTTCLMFNPVKVMYLLMFDISLVEKRVIRKINDI